MLPFKRPAATSVEPPAVVITARRLRAALWAAVAPVAADLSLVGFGDEPHDAAASAFARVLDYLDATGSDALPAIEIVIR